MTPQAGITGCIRLPDLMNDVPFVEHLRDRYDTQVVPGTFFEAPGFIRLSFGVDPAMLEEALVRKAKVEAAKQDKSLSRYISELVERELGEGNGDSGYSPEYRAAMEAWRAQEPFLVREPGTRWPKREELYDRPYLRRHERAALREGRSRDDEEGGGEGMD